MFLKSQNCGLYVCVCVCIIYLKREKVEWQHLILTQDLDILKSCISRLFASNSSVLSQDESVILS